MARFTVHRYCGLAAWLIALAGCGDADVRPSASISGQILLDGVPLRDGSVQFTSPKTGETAYANLDGDGRYQVTFPRADVGAEYEVTVGVTVEEDLDPVAITRNRSKGPLTLVPRKYSDRTTSGLTATITTAGENQFDFELHGP